MVYLLLLMLLLLLGVAYYFSYRNILSPTVVVCAGFVFGVFFAVLNVNRWGFTLDPLTVIVIVSGIGAFWAGELIVNSRYDRREIRVPDHEICRPLSAIHVPGWMIFLIATGMVLMAVYYFLDMYRLSLTGGNPGGFSLMLHYAREAQLKRLGYIDSFSFHFTLATNAVSTVFIYLFFRNLVASGFRLKLLWQCVPIFLNVPIMVLSGGRTQIISWIVSMVIIGFVLYQNKHRWHPGNTPKILLGAGLAAGVFLVIFTLAGYLTGKSQTRSSYDMISLYAGLSVPSLDQYLLNPLPDTGMIGDHTLYPIYSTLRTFGFDLPDLYAPYEFIRFNDVFGNVYTALRRYIQDYTYPGMLLIMFLMGFGYSAFFRKAKRNVGLWLVCYAVFCCPLVMMFFEDQFFLSLLGISTIYHLGYLFAFYLALVWWPQKRTSTVETRRRCRPQYQGRRFQAEVD